MSGRAGVAGPEDRSAATAVRTRVFVEEQGVPPEVEQDATDAIAVHAVSRDAEGRVVATGRLFERDGCGVIGRMAVDAAVRGSGHGTAVLRVLHQEALRLGLAEVEIHAQVGARRFWEGAGYTAVGEEYEEAGIRHVTMRRRLDTV